MLAVVDSQIPSSAARALEKEGFSLLRLPPHPALPPSVASHPDMLLFFGRDRVYTTPLYAKIATKELEQILCVTQKELFIIHGEIEADYPKDVLLNSCFLGKHLICHPHATATEILEFEEAGILPTRQGYAKCSTIPLGNNALITADPSIQQAAIESRINVLRLKEQGTRLKGYDTGFIGGASSFAPYGGSNVIYFCGDLSQHPQSKEIQDFCGIYGYACTSLSAIPLTDVGTIFILS